MALPLYHFCRVVLSIQHLFYLLLWIENVFYLASTVFYDDSALLHLVLHLPFVLIVAILLSLSVERSLYLCKDL